MSTFFAIIALVGVAITLASLIYLHAARTGLNPVSAAVSEYGISSKRQGYRVATLALGIAAIALGIALNDALATPNVVALIFLLLFGIARLIISWAPIDEPGASRTRVGLLHNILAFVFFASATVAAFLYSGTFASDPVFDAITGISTALAWIMAAFSAFVIAASIVTSLKPVFGVAERLLYLAIIVWMIIVAAAVLAA